jgi:hypothetical protein
MILESADLITHSAMQDLTHDEKLYIRNSLIEIANSLLALMPTHGKLG